MHYPPFNAAIQHTQRKKERESAARANGAAAASHLPATATGDRGRYIILYRPAE